MSEPIEKKVLITGAAGFIGRHLVEALRRRAGTRVWACLVDTPHTILDEGLRQADIVFHLAGVNRPERTEDFRLCNADFTRALCERLRALPRQPVLVLTSSIQAVQANPYGESKRAAEMAVEEWSTGGGGTGIVFRLKNVFGKWCRPNYNSVTATFCHNIARDLPITISDPARELELVYIDDVVASMVACLELEPVVGFSYREVSPSYRITLGRLADMIRSFRTSRSTLALPKADDDFERRLYATFVSYLEPADFSYGLEQRSDARGTLAEFLKSPQLGQVFVSRTNPGVTRGNHYHHSKTEKFFVVEGDAVVRFRQIDGTEVIEHRVSGRDFRVVDIPPGYTHSIENIGSGELVTLFWANEIFDPGRPDTIMLPVIT